LFKFPGIWIFIAFLFLQRMNNSPCGSSRTNQVNMTDRERFVYKAKVAEQAELFEEMVQIMRQVVTLNPSLSVEERNLLSIAYKNLIGTRRTAWRIVHSLEEKERNKDPNSWKLKQMGELRSTFEEKLHKISVEILDLIDTSLIPAAGSDNLNEPKVFWYKMKGDYYRYIAEFERDNKKAEAQEKALSSYQKALDESKELKCTNPILLGLALNFSVFYYEIMNDKDKACEMAKKYFDAAIPEIDKLDGDDYKDTTLILQLLRDNLSLWTASESDDSDEN